MGITQLTHVIQIHASSAIKEISSDTLKGKVIAVDASIVLNQFVHKCASMDEFIIGVFHRTTNLLGHGLKPVFVFEGKPNPLKSEEHSRRERVRSQSDLVKVTEQHVIVCKSMLSMLGVPCIDAAEDAEAQCVELVKRGKCYAVVSEDLDTLPFGGKILLRNLKFSDGEWTATSIKLDGVIRGMNMDMASFVDFCILLGCDYVTTIPSVGKVTALEMIRKYKTIENILSNTSYVVPEGWLDRVQEVRRLFAQPKVVDVSKLKLECGPPKEQQLLELLCKQHGAAVIEIKKKIHLLNTERQMTDVVAQFLKENLFADYTRIYCTELKSLYTAFLNQHPTLTKYSFQEITKYCKERKLFHYKGSHYNFKTRYVHKRNGHYRIYIVTAAILKSSGFFACNICERGFSTHNGRAAHNSSTSHISLVTSLVAKTRPFQGNYYCPVNDCLKSFPKHSDYKNHLTQDEWSHVTIAEPAMLTPHEFNAETDDPSLWCVVCNIRTTSEFNMNQHKQGRKHRHNCLKNDYRQKRQELLEATTREVLCLTFEGENLTMENSAVFKMPGQPLVPKTIKCKIENTSHDTDIELMDIQSLNDMALVDINPVGPQLIPPTKCTHVRVTLKPKQHGLIRVAILFTFKRSGDVFMVSREVLIECVSNPEIFQKLKPSAPYNKLRCRKININDEVVRSDTKPDMESSYALERTQRLDNYFIPSVVKTCLRNLMSAGDSATNKYEELVKELNLKTLDFSNYSVYYSNLLYLEEHQMAIDIDHYTMDDVTMTVDSRTGLLRLKVPGLAENRPSVLKGDKLYVTPLPASGRKYEGYVHNVTLTELFIGFNNSLTKNHIKKMKFRVQFTINRLSLKLEHRAVSWAGEHGSTGLGKLLFPSRANSIPPLTSPETLQHSCFEKRVEKNVEQLTAIKHIVAGSSRPAPYLIYGPPGTGKTFTLVEAIKQVYKTFPTARILACAPQNAAADLLASRLLDHLPTDCMLRLNALSRPYGDIEKKVQAVSNYRSRSGVVSHAVKHGLSGKSKQGDMEVEYPKKAVLKQKKIIISTLVTSGRLVSAEMGNHFTHIFIDEAGHATEPETVIPLAGLLNVNMTNGGQVVLAGDPQQLGPVIRSYIASKRGLESSLLERFMYMDLYKRQEGEFSPAYVTKLVRSFRSHPDILEVPNSCFYDNELLACADRMKRERFCQWEDLPTKGFPLIFHGVDGQEEQEGNSPSWFNRYEVMQVIHYVQRLFECKKPRVTHLDVGIISPYHKQVNKIMDGLRSLEVAAAGRTRDFAKIKVGSVEKFQGSEKEIIIISTVRSQDMYLTHDKKFNLGFVRNPKRFNVAVTRAKSLLIVIGNPAVLRKDENWLRLLSHIEEGGGCLGCPLSDEDIDDKTDIDALSQRFESLGLHNEAQEMPDASETSQGLLLGDQEWRRKE